MDETLWGVINILGPIILGGLLLWLVLKSRSGRKRDDDVPERATHDLYADEERRRRDGTDDL